MMTNSQESFTSLSSFLPPAFSFLNFSCTFWISTQEQVSASQAQPGKHWVAEAQPQVQVLSDQVRPWCKIYFQVFILESTNNLLETASLCVNIHALALAQLTLEPWIFPGEAKR